jgi:hypothetical protein
MLLRRFYIQENEKAPEPKQKKTRELKTDIVPLEVANRELIESLGRTKGPAALVRRVVASAPATPVAAGAPVVSFPPAPLGQAP